MVVVRKGKPMSSTCSGLGGGGVRALSACTTAGGAAACTVPGRGGTRSPPGVPLGRSCSTRGGARDPRDPRDPRESCLGLLEVVDSAAE